jgi:hypothetical protein
MLNETTRVSNDDVHQMFQVVHLLSEPDAASHAPVTAKSWDEGTYARAIQALRDVRHMLPGEGVAIVDDVLDCAI